MDNLVGQSDRDRTQSFTAHEFESNIYFVTITLSINKDEMLLLFENLIKGSLVKKSNNSENKKPEITYKITPQGLSYFDNENTTCVICKNKNIDIDNSWFSLRETTVMTGEHCSDDYHQICPYCGEFKISQSALDIFNQYYDDTYDQHVKKISGWITAKNSAGETPTITKNNLNNLLALTLPSVMERATNILQAASKELPWVGSEFYGYRPNYYGISYSTEKDEIIYLLNLLIAKGLIDRAPRAKRAENSGKNFGPFLLEILPQGHIYLDEQKAKASSSHSHQGFVAMWFDPDLNTAYNDGIQTGILNAGYSSVRMDRTEHVNSIDDEMIVQIKASKFVVADFTGHRGNVYFEAGYAMGLNIPVIWSCRKDHVNDLLFDIRQFNYIRWETPEELAERLRLRIEAIIGPGPNKLM